MTRLHQSCPIFALALLVSGCGQENSSPGPGPTSADEARALSEAAEMIGEARTAPTPSESAGETPENEESAAAEASP